MTNQSVHHQAGQNGAVSGQVHLFLRLEGLAMLAAMVALYAHMEGSWWMFGILFLSPDIFMLGYLAGPRLGALAYNLGHSYPAPALLAAIGALAASPLLLQLAVIWFAHIGFDRIMGYGLKYDAGFRFTHLGRIGKA